MIKRLFYFTGYRLSVLHWQGKTLTGTISFEPTADGLDQFESYLMESENIASKFLVDVIEEDFRSEHIPHVGSADRKAVVSRLMDRFYRSSRDYCYDEVIGRIRSGRKDDVILLGAMTNPQLIQPWIALIEKHEVPLAGIWTLPIISRSLLKVIGAKSSVVLLVSQQVNSNIRQSLFRDGKLVSSRQSIINQDINDISSIGQLAKPEVDRTVTFLRAQGQIHDNEVIDLHILGAEEQLDSLNDSFKDSESQKVTIHSIEALHKKAGLKNASSRFSNNLFAWLCCNQKYTQSHYGPKRLFAAYRNRMTAMVLYVASALVVITGVLLTEANLSDAMEYDRSIKLLKQQESGYKELYSKKFKAFEGVFENAGVMNSAVELAERIRNNGMTSPLDFMIKLSQILNTDIINGVIIDKIEWRAVNIDGKTHKQNKANFTSSDEVYHDAVITGRIHEPEYNYRASIEHVQKIIAQLKADKRVESVEALKMPVDLRSESNFATQTGVENAVKQGTENKGVFSLRVIMRAPRHV